MQAFLNYKRDCPKQTRTSSNQFTCRYRCGTDKVQVWKKQKHFENMG